MTAVALVVAAGRGERLGAGGPKALVPCAGRPLLSWSLDVLLECAGIAAVVVAVPPGIPHEELLPREVIGVPGGRERSHSVRAALAAAPPGPELVLVHDAARPLLTREVVEQALAAVAIDEAVDAAIAAAPVNDTVKRVGADGRTVEATLDRARLWAVQTPQVFRRATLTRVLAQDDAVLAAATDDASLIEADGGRVIVVPAPPENFKVTTPHDLWLAELLLTRR